MINLLIISALLYLVWVLAYLRRNRIRKFLFSKPKLSPIIPPIESIDDDVMGKTKTQLRHVETNDDSLRQIEKPIEIAPTFASSNEISKSARIDDNELDSAFSDSPGVMDLDIECEYEEVGFLEEEYLNCFVDDEKIKPATGIEFDEMENLIQVMQQSKASPAAELSAVNTIQELDQTELFQLMVSQIAGGKERVTEMLNKYKADFPKVNSINVESHDGDFQQFEINNFL
ncbi:MAG: hypothetical protein ABFC90_12225 [Bacteroidales bacterium]